MTRRKLSALLRREAKSEKKAEEICLQKKSM